MERETTTHGRRLDEEMKSETGAMTSGAPVEGRTRDERAQEDLPADAALVEGSWRGEVSGGSAPDPVVVEMRAELARRLAGTEWPADRSAVVRRVREADLPPGIAALVQGLPERTYDRFQSVWDALEAVAAARAG